jgi:hypothetical protein
MRGTRAESEQGCEGDNHPGGEVDERGGGGETAVHRIPATALAARFPKLWMPAKTPKAEPRRSAGATDATAAFWEVSTQPMARPDRRKAGASARTEDPPTAKPM